MRALCVLLTSATLLSAQEAALEQPFTEEVALLDLPTSYPQISTLDPSPIQPIETPTPHFELPKKSPFLAVTLSALVPGLGHTYLGDFATAGGIFGSTVAGTGVFAFENIDTSVRISSLITAQAAWSYGIYAAYRDVRLFNRQEGYSYKMPTDSLTALTSAPFRWSILKKPEVWGGFFGALALGVGTIYLSGDYKASKQTASFSGGGISPVVALPIGISEEALFRGCIQSQLAEFLPPWAAITVSSIAFGAAHIPNAILMPKEDQKRYYTFSVPFITALGAYLGWMTHKNHSLQESVALHTWYDFALMAASSWAAKAAIGRPEFALAIPF